MTVRGRVLVALLVLAGLVTVPAAPAGAHNVYYAYRSCTYEAQQQLQDITVGIDPGAAFPSPSIHDGVWNSFPDRLNEAIARMDTHIMGTGLVPNGMRRVTSGDMFVIVGYRELGSGTTLGSTTRSFLSGTYISCSMHGTNRSMIDRTWIDIDIRGYWFTQDDSRRAFWEACVPNTSYTCERLDDFGAVALHELGHAVGMDHPQDVNTHTGNTIATSASYGNCASLTAFNTMCAINPSRRSTGRTFDTWDIETLRRQYLAT